jgi:hypothetical protein
LMDPGNTEVTVGIPLLSCLQAEVIPVRRLPS